MAGETRIATPLELALVEALSDAGCMVRSLNLASKEAAGAGQKELAGRLERAAVQLGGGAQDEIIAVLSEELGLTADRTWALQTDPDGAITRELMLARADARAMNVHLERAMGFGAEREDRLDLEAEGDRIAAEITAKRAEELTKSAVAKKTAPAKTAAPAKAAPAAEKKLADAPPAVQKAVGAMAKAAVAQLKETAPAEAAALEKKAQADAAAEKSAAEKSRVDELVAKAREEGAAKRAAAAAKAAANPSPAVAAAQKNAASPTGVAKPAPDTK